MTQTTPKILITGGSGFIGTNLVEHYVRAGWQVLNVDVVGPMNPAHAEYFRKADLLDAPALREIFVRFNPDYVVHLAARTDLNETRDIKGYDANIQGVRNVIDALKELKSLRRVIFASSMLVCRYGYVPKHEADYCPSTLYGQSKVWTENIIREMPLPFEWLIVRPTSIWGPWFGPPYNLFFKYVLAGKFFSSRKSRRDMHIRVHRQRGLSDKFVASRKGRMRQNVLSRRCSAEQSQRVGRRNSPACR